MLREAGCFHRSVKEVGMYNWMKIAFHSLYASPKAGEEVLGYE